MADKRAELCFSLSVELFLVASDLVVHTKLAFLYLNTKQWDEWIFTQTMYSKKGVRNRVTMSDARMEREKKKDEINLVAVCLISNADHIWRLTIENSYTNTILMNPSVLISNRTENGPNTQITNSNSISRIDIINMLIECANLCACQCAPAAHFASRYNINIAQRQSFLARNLERNKSTSTQQWDCNLIYLHLIQYSN